MINRIRSIGNLTPAEIDDALKYQAREQVESLKEAETLSQAMTKEFKALRREKVKDRDPHVGISRDYGKGLLRHFRETANKVSRGGAPMYWHMNEPFEADAAICLALHIAKYTNDPIRVYVSETGVPLDLMVLSKHYSQLKEVCIRRQYVPDWYCCILLPSHIGCWENSARSWLCI